MPAYAFSSEIDDLLTHAESVKSNDPGQLKQILDTLQANQTTLSHQQRFRFHYLEGYSAGFNGDMTTAIAKYRLVIGGTQDDSLRVQTTAALLNLYGLTRDYPEGYALASKLSALSSEVSDALYAQILIAKAIFFNQAEDHEAALSAALQAVTLIEHPRLVCFTQNLIVEAKYHLNTISDSDIFKQAVAACRSANEPIATALTYIFQARFLFMQGNDRQALDLIQSHSDLFDSLSYPRVEADYLAILATLYVHTGQLKKAEETAQQALIMSDGMGSAKPRVEAYKVLSQVYESQGLTTKALSAFKHFARLEKANIDDSLLNRLAALQAKTNLQSKESRIQILDKQNSLLVTAAQLKNEELENSRLLIIVLLLAGVIVIIWFFSNRKIQLELREQAQTDRLTGVANRHYFTQLAESNLRYHERTQQALGFIIFDLDLFKTINDTYGHQAGDWVLKAVTDAVQSVCRKQDIIGRMGGEEFALLLPGCPMTRAQQLAEACRREIANINTATTGASFTITASFGVADTDICGYSFDDLYAKADAALYRSKREGRNQVFCYDPAEAQVFTLIQQPV